MTSEPAWVIQYAYLWAWEAERGQTEAQKDRPCLILAVDESEVLVMPLTTREPQPDQFAVELPQRTRARLELGYRCWVIAQEVNVIDPWPGPDLRRTPNGDEAYGLIPDRLMMAVKTEFVAALGAGTLTSIARDI